MVAVGQFEVCVGTVLNSHIMATTFQTVDADLMDLNYDCVHTWDDQYVFIFRHRKPARIPWIVQKVTFEKHDSSAV